MLIELVRIAQIEHYKQVHRNRDCKFQQSVVNLSEVPAIVKGATLDSEDSAVFGAHTFSQLYIDDDHHIIYSVIAVHDKAVVLKMIFGEKQENKKTSAEFYPLKNRYGHNYIRRRMLFYMFDINMIT